jgi:hypothetical protein
MLIYVCLNRLVIFLTCCLFVVEYCPCFFFSYFFCLKMNGFVLYIFGFRFFGKLCGNLLFLVISLILILLFLSGGNGINGKNYYFVSGGCFVENFNFKRTLFRCKYIAYQDHDVTKHSRSF